MALLGYYLYAVMEVAKNNPELFQWLTNDHWDEMLKSYYLDDEEHWQSHSHPY